MGAGAGHKRRGAEEFREKFTRLRLMPHTVRSAVAECEAREGMVNGTSAAP